MLSTTAMSTTLDSFFFENGYTQPQSIVEIQQLVDDGTYYNYPYIAGGGVEKGLFKDKLKDGTALPQIQNITALLAALDMKQVVLVANADGSFSGTLPIFAEIAKQNGVTGEELMAHLIANQIDGEDFFSNIDDVIGTVQSKIDEITAELNDEVQEEISQEVTEAVTEAVQEEIDTALQDAIDSVVRGDDPLFSDEDFANQVADAIDGYEVYDTVEGGPNGRSGYGVGEE